MTGDSILTSLTGASIGSGETIINIHGNGHTVRYDRSLQANQWLSGKTYSWRTAAS